MESSLIYDAIYYDLMYVLSKLASKPHILVMHACIYIAIEHIWWFN